MKHDITIADFMFRERAVVESAWALIDENLKRHQVTAVQGSACIVGPKTIEVTRYGQPDRVAHRRRDPRRDGLASPAAGAASPWTAAIIVDSDSLLTLERIPARMIVIGGGVIGCEYACIFAALGVQVTIVNARSRLLAHLDAEVGDALRRQITARLGISVHVDVEVSGLVVEGQTARVDLSDGTAAACRRGALQRGPRRQHERPRARDSSACAATSAATCRSTRNYRTAVPSIYAAGDVIGFPALASTAMEQARVAVCHAFDLKYKQRVSPVLPYGVWTIPEIATVGATEDALVARGVRYEVGRSSYRANPRGQILGETDGFVKLIFDPDDQRVLGASIVGEGACELIHLAASVMTFGGTIDYFIQGVFNFPALSDAYKYAAYDGLQALARRRAKTPGLPTSGEQRVVKT